MGIGNYIICEGLFCILIMKGGGIEIHVTWQIHGLAGDCSLLYMKEKKWNILGYLLKQIDHFIDNFSSQIVNKTISTKITLFSQHKNLKLHCQEENKKIWREDLFFKKKYFFKIFLERERKKNCVHSIFSKGEI